MRLSLHRLPLATMLIGQVCFESSTDASQKASFFPHLTTNQHMVVHELKVSEIKEWREFRCRIVPLYASPLKVLAAACGPGILFMGA